MKPTLIYLYGPPASGKLTVAEKLSELTGYTLFHNHLTVNAIRSVFPFGSEAYEGVLHRLRLDVFRTAANAGSNLIFTNNSAWGPPNGRGRFVAFAGEAKHAVETAGGRLVFVRLSAPLSILEDRLESESRRAHKKLLDVEQLRRLFVDLDESPLYHDDLSIDTSAVSADVAARSIADTLS
ncbi:MAG TPA: AAA family ATPase [Acidimicrobiales bacterium]|jgi:hypothetical protein